MGRKRKKKKKDGKKEEEGKKKEEKEMGDEKNKKEMKRQGLSCRTCNYKKSTMCKEEVQSTKKRGYRKRKVVDVLELWNASYFSF